MHSLRKQWDPGHMHLGSGKNMDDFLETFFLDFGCLIFV